MGSPDSGPRGAGRAMQVAGVLSVAKDLRSCHPERSGGSAVPRPKPTWGADQSGFGEFSRIRSTWREISLVNEQYCFENTLERPSAPEAFRGCGKVLQARVSIATSLSESRIRDDRSGTAGGDVRRQSLRATAASLGASFRPVIPEVAVYLKRASRRFLLVAGLVPRHRDPWSVRRRSAMLPLVPALAHPSNGPRDHPHSLRDIVACRRSRLRYKETKRCRPSGRRSWYCCCLRQ